MFEHLICVELSSIDCKIECLIATSDSALHEASLILCSFSLQLCYDCTSPDKGMKFDDHSFVHLAVRMAIEARE